MSAAKQRLRRYSEDVAKQMEPNNFVDDLYAKSILSEDNKEKIQGQQGRLKRARTLLTIMETKGEQKINEFFQVLKTADEDKQPHLYGLFFPNGDSLQTGMPAVTESPTTPVTETADASSQVRTRHREATGRSEQQRKPATSRNQQNRQSNRKRRDVYKILFSVIGFTLTVLLSWGIYHYITAVDDSTKTSPSQQPDRSATKRDGKSADTQTEGDDLDMTAHIDDKQIIAIAGAAGNQWEEIGINLGFKKQELSRYEHKFRDDWDKRLRELLFAWKERNDNPTLDKVVRACEDAKVGPAVRRALGSVISRDG